MTIRQLLSASLFAAFVLGLSALPMTIQSNSDGLTFAKAAFAKDDMEKGKKDKKEKEKKEKKNKKERMDKNCTKDQPCNDDNENRKDGEHKGQSKDHKGKDD